MNMDELLKRALTQDEAKQLQALDEQGVLAQIADSFRGRSRGLVIMAFLHGIGMLGLGLVSLRQFFQAQERHEMILWASLMVVSVLAIGLVKVWYWMELNKSAILRELKRMEYQIALLSKKVS